MIRPRLLTLLALVLTLAFVVGACGSSSPSATTGPAATNTAAPTSPSGTPVPATATPRPIVAPSPTATAVPVSSGSITVRVAQFGAIVMVPDQNGGIDGPLGILYDPNYASDPTTKLEPKRGFANSWEASPDSMTWTFKTKDNVTFHDGVKATARDLKYVYEFSMQQGSTSSKASTLNANVASMENPDDNTLVIKLKTPDIFWVYTYSLTGAARRPAWLLPRHYVSSVGLAGVNRAPIGSGPFKFNQVAIDKLSMEAVPKHWFFGVPRTKTVTFWQVQEENTAIALMKTGEVDLSAVTIAALKSVQDSPNLRAIVRKGQAGYTYFFREIFAESYPGYGKNPFANVRVRQAMHWHALDRAAIVDGFRKGIAEPAMDYPVLPQEVSWAGPLPLKEYSVAKAKELLTAAGFPNGFEMDQLVFSATDEVAEAVAVMWEKLGLKVNRVSMSEANFRAGMFANPGKSYFKKPTAVFSYTIATGSIASNFAVIPHTDPWISNLDPEGVRLAKEWAASPTVDEYKKRGQAYRLWEYENISSFSPIFTTGDIVAVGAKIPATWVPGQDPSNLTRMDYAFAAR